MALQEVAKPSEGAEAARRLTLGQHVCFIYEHPAELAEVAAGYLLGGLERAEKCLFIANDLPHDAVREALARLGVDHEAAEREGRLRLVGKHDVYLRDGEFEPDAVTAFIAEASRNAGSSFTGVRGMGEMSFACDLEHGFRRLIEYEAKVNRLFDGTLPFVGFCAYQRSRFPAEVLTEILKVHPVVHYAGRTYQNFFYVPPEEYLGQRNASVELDRLLENLQARQALEMQQALAQERHRELERLRRTMEEDARMLGVAAHELSNPITPLRMQLDMLRMEGRTLPAHLDVMERSLARMELVLGDLAAAARSRHSTGLARTRVELRAVLADVIEELAPVAARKGIRITLRAAPGHAEADQVRLVQAMFNLVSNAVKYTGPGGRVEVSLEPDSGGWRMCVRDNGAGLEAEEIPRLFHTFSRVGRPLEPGTGLGLYIARVVAERHGGWVRAESPGRGRGSTFTLWIPSSCEAGGAVTPSIVPGP